MVIEFKKVEEWVLLSLKSHISIRFDEFVYPDNIPGKSKSSKELCEYKAQQILENILSNYRALYDQESIRIQNAIYEYEGNNEKDKFDKYLILNYKKLIELYKPQDIDYFFDLSKSKIIYNEDVSAKDFIYWSIKSSFQIFFVKVLLAFFEKNFKNILLEHNLLPSPSDNFINTISVFNLEFGLIDPVPDNWEYMVHNGSVSIITLSFNGYDDKNKYKADLFKQYNEFKLYISGLVNSQQPDYYKTFSLLNNLLINLDELQRSYEIENDISLTEALDLQHLKNKNLVVKRDTKLRDFQNWPHYYYNKYNNFLNIQMDITDNAYRFIKKQINLFKELKELASPNTEDTNFQKTKLANKSTKEITNKLQWRGNINQLITFFYDAAKEVLYKGKPILNADRKQITELLLNNFIDKDGNEVNKSTIDTIFTPSKVTKRPSTNKRITIPVNE